jgi:hypothetical protein
VVTDAGFILIVFFPLFVFVMSMIQRHLEKRKEARKARAQSPGAAAGRPVARRLVSAARFAARPATLAAAHGR